MNTSVELKANVGCCEEASPHSHQSYIPCNAPAVKMIGFAEGERPYRMCLPCATHNLKNRGAKDMGTYTPAIGETPLTRTPPTPAEKEVDLSAYAQDAELSIEEKGNILAQITRTARELRDAEEDVKSAEEMLKRAQDRVRNLSENILPQLMDEAQQKRLTTIDGWDIERTETVRAGISQENMPAAVAWLNANGHPIAKTELSLQFGRGEEQRVAEAVSALREHGMPPKEKLSVHFKTLESLVKELLSKGQEFPADLLGVYIQPRVKMRRP